MQQTAFSFDSVTARKIWKGAYHSLIVTLLLGALETASQLAGTVHFVDPVMTMVYAYAIQNIYNVLKEYVSGIPAPSAE